MKKSLTFIIICIIGIFAGNVHAKIYSWTDPDGVKHFSTVNVPVESIRQAVAKENPCANYTNDYDMIFVIMKACK